MNSRSRQTRLNLALLFGGSLIGLVSLAHAPGLAAGLIYVGPVMFAVMLLWLGHYPGERLLEALVAPYSRRRAARGPTAHLQVCLGMPRGAALLASALAGRAPPVTDRICNEATFRSLSTFAITPVAA